MIAENMVDFPTLGRPTIPQLSMAIPPNYNILRMNEEIQGTMRATLVVCEDNLPDAERKRDELESLCQTAGIKTVGWSHFKIRSVNPATYIGKGQLMRLLYQAQETESDLIVFNNSLSPRVQRNLEAETNLCVIDRQEVILQIFSQRAQTREAVLQVQLARLQYSLPRLTRRWANLSQQRGGVRGSKGSGEKQLELDRRAAQNRINILKKRIAEISVQRNVQRHGRSVNSIPTFAIAGYTNSGKSTLLNRLSGADVLAKDMLFATLDTTTRRIELKDGTPVLVTDTVGFVSDLPHELVDAFKSTLEEASLTDALIIVLDASSPDLLLHWETTKEVLTSLNAFDKPKLVVLNKADLLTEENMFAIQAFMAKGEHTLCMSVLKDDLNNLYEEMRQIVE